MIVVTRLTLLLTFILFSAPVYAIIVWDGKIVPAWPEQHRAILAKKAQKEAPTTSGFGFYTKPDDTTYGLTLIVDFSDEPATFGVSQINDWLNKSGYSEGKTEGSVRDYFFDISNGKFLIVNDVYGYYRAKNPKSYYEASTSYARAAELVNEVIAYFDPTVDYSKYDNDKNGSTEAISIVYAGTGQTWGEGLWPHSGYINQTKDGVRLGNYNMCDMGTNLGIYVFCHECGHMIFGWPDLYWFGDYCIMGNRMSDVNPVPVNDFFRADQGWIPTVTITKDENTRYRMVTNETGYRYVNPDNPRQMYYWTNIANTGRYASLRGRGMLLFMYDGSIQGNTSGSSRCLYVVEADGNNAMANQQWPSPGSTSKDFYSLSNNKTFSSKTTPAAQWGLTIYDISAATDTMEFSVGTGTITACQQGEKVRSQMENALPAAAFDLLGRCSSLSPGASASRTVSFSNTLFIIKGEDGFRTWHSLTK